METSGAVNNSGEEAILRLTIEVPTSRIGAEALGEEVAEHFAASYAGAAVVGRQVVVVSEGESDAQPSVPETGSWSRLLGQDIEEVIEEKEIWQSISITRYVNSLRRGSINTVRDLLAAGRTYIGRIPQSGQATQKVADEIIEACNLDEHWYPEPTVEAIATFYDDLGQVSDLVIWRRRELMVYALLHEHLSVQQVLALSDEAILGRLFDDRKMLGMNDDRRARLAWNVRYAAERFASEFAEAKERITQSSS